MNALVALSIVAVLVMLPMQSSMNLANHVTGPLEVQCIQPGAYLVLSSSWRWSAFGIGDLHGYRTETEDRNDTITVQELSGSQLLLKLRQVGRASIEASDDFVISGIKFSSREINREYLLRVDLATLRDLDGRPIRWIANVNELCASGAVPQMWTDENYAFVEVQFHVSGSEPVTVVGRAVNAWSVSYRNLTTGYWSRGGSYAIGFKHETLNFDKTCGFLLRDRYSGSYGLEFEGGGWNETETYSASVVDSNVDFLEHQEPVKAAQAAASVVVPVAALILIIVAAAGVRKHSRATGSRSKPVSQN